MGEDPVRGTEREEQARNAAGSDGACAENLTEAIGSALRLSSLDASQFAPLALAYIGDTVYELVNRTAAVSKGSRSSEKLHKECSSRAKAGSQAEVARRIAPLLTEEETAVLRRGRNAAVYTKAKNATTEDYHLATGLEALIGYLYLTGRFERLNELIAEGWRETGLWTPEERNG